MAADRSDTREDRKERRCLGRVLDALSLHHISFAQRRLCGYGLEGMLPVLYGIRPADDGSRVSRQLSKYYCTTTT